MSKPSLSLRVPRNILTDIEEIQEQEGIDDRSEAARQVLRRGVERSRRRTASEQLIGNMTGVAGVGAVVALVGAVVGQAWAVSLVIPFGATTAIFALMWASVRTLEGRDLL